VHHALQIHISRGRSEDVHKQQGLVNSG
jgi:hypothetical protein